ncbi:ankyrin repeat-containing protein kinase A-like [Rhagoletis pomonella]|uniref:ankyrin repeat-containing protein kinase A-like n=1 Tax=Rhagoletis pomonella TaxID=28610 RepID=UPI0017821682|nr:ankyrin repeat-containing protein kinase A-like [Rhagoletis pomonella]
MDAKNDDSAGSDSLDKSLQKKCVVDDVGQGEGSTANAALAQGISERNDKQKSDTDAENHPPAISNNSQNKTEKSAGDGVCGSVLENSCRVEGKYESSSIHNAGIANDSETALVVDDAHEAANVANVNSNAAEGKTYTLNSDDAAISNNIENDAAEAPSESNSNSSNNSTNSNSNCSSNNSYVFETKVKRISKNLKETTLAECANKKASADDTNSTSSASSASSASSTPECEQATVDDATAALYSLGPSTSAAAAAAAAAVAGGASGQDEHDHRSKKVRFHPDVKENDGGNRVIPKKKKKLKTAQAGGSPGSGAGGAGDDASGSSQRGTSAEDDMEFDEEEDVEEEGTFSIAKTIEDAQDYLKEHPLTFAGSFDKSNVTTQSGLLEEGDLPQLAEASEDDDEDFCGQELPENGVACILGKQNKCGKVEFLLRYVDRPGLFWETEELIGQRCPNLLNQYEQCREKRQARLMNFVAKRQNLRQRYTDF